MRIVRRRDGQGQTLVEFTLIIPLFLLIVLAVAEGGYYVAAASVANHATHEGARTGILASTSSTATVQNKVRDSAQPIVGTFDEIKVCIEGSGCTNSDYQDREAGDRLHITTKFTHRPLVGYVFGSVTFPTTTEAELRVEGAPSS